MKYTYRIIMALVAYLLGLAAFLYYQSSSEHNSNQLAPVNLGSEVTLSFRGCSGKYSIFVLENHTEEAIYAPVQIVWFERWREILDAGLETGMVMVEYKSPNSQSFEDVTPPELMRPSAFFLVFPHRNIKIGTDLPMGEGLYRVKAPYLELDDAVPVLRTNESSVLTVDDYERLNTLWKEAQSDTVLSACK